MCVVQEIMLEFKSDIYIQASAIEALQEAAEAILVTKFESKYILYYSFY